jgi:flavoprotein
MNHRGRKKAPLRANYSIANYLKTYSKAMVTQILDTLIENAVNHTHSKIVATEIIDDILKGAVKTDNNSTKRKHSVTDKIFVTWKEKFPWLCKVEKNGIPYLQCTECISAASKGIKISSVWGHDGAPNSQFSAVTRHNRIVYLF